jgi:hypothetical protein
VSRAVAARFYAAFNARDLAGAAALIDASARWHVMPTGQVLPGREGFLGWAQAFIARHPDAHVDVLGFVEEGDRCVSELVIHGAEAIPTCEVLRFAGGLIVDARVYFDRGPSSP